MKLEVVGVESLLKLIDALTTQQSTYKLTVSTDSEQALKGSYCRAFMVEVESDYSLDEQFAEPLEMLNKLGVKK